MEEEDDGPPGVPEWVVTYGDMMSLLLTFFIMLVSMSEISEKSRYREVLASLHDRLGYPAGAMSAPGEQHAGTASNSVEVEAGEEPVEAPGDGGTPRPNSPGRSPMLSRETPGRPVSAGPSILFAKLADRP
ncbi:MAG: flagellar motor protein MotB, partial [Planctomycetota bacterium]